ncbi:polysaccharide deacetylase family protein [Phragmitibacter flavus]|uniref:polysaccharide deacetylase family protein n=1 Tax=Phragmitibacter flavus TaxID=2576071 RepID=UPI00140BE5CC|nr:polysaccharide deacetylase family protein [Phragmitibacter flavus]
MLTSCLEKLEQFLPKPPPKAVQIEEPPLTEEEKRLQDTLATSDVLTPIDVEVPKAVEFELNKSSVVSLLLYHDFTPRIPRNEMTISVPKFRAQMQALKDAEIPVISMSDLLAWKRGEKNIPDNAVVITIDDGWLGTYEHAFPVLKEFNYPFVLYLYKKFVGTGGRSMTLEQVRDMLAHGGELGSHTLSHDALALGKRGRNAEQYQAWLQAEIGDSKTWIESTFGVTCTTLAYPYGNKNEEVVKFTLDTGYEAAVTVNPQKTTWDTPNGEIPRFTQLGDSDGNFKLATSFRGLGAAIADSKFIKTDAVNEKGEKLVELLPAPNSTITERRPVLQADLSRIGPVLPESIVLRIAGFGTVPAIFDPNSQIISYRVPQRIRLESCSATLTFRRVGADKDEILNWQFNIDRNASYAPQTEFDTGSKETAAR